MGLKMTKFGLYFDTLSPTQALYEAIFSANKVLGARPDIDITLFYANLGAPPILPNFAQCQAHSAWKFDGTILATNIQDALFISKLPQAKRKILMAYDLAHYGHARLPYEICLQGYRNPHLEVWARSESHRAALETCFNINVNVCKDFDYLNWIN
jgi:hypothetical protein